MSYESVDVLQNILATEVFHYAKDSKKASGRALGTLVEIVTFYLLKAWGYEKRTAIERRIPEYGNPGLTHNVEFTLHPTHHIADIELEESKLPFTAKKIKREIGKKGIWDNDKIKNTQLLSNAKLLRNSCAIYEDMNQLDIAYLGDTIDGKWRVSIERLHTHPFAMVECKRVGVEEGVKKGPQTIEKAKQGAYVAQSVSSLQKIKKMDGSFYGILPMPDSSLSVKPYDEFIRTIIESNDFDLLNGFILTIGIVSNHGNWFTSNDINKELEVLAQSYDWLVFLTDEGLSTFIRDLLLEPHADYQAARMAFIESYNGTRNRNKFTKVMIRLSADRAIQRYFRNNLSQIENWFNVISPKKASINALKRDIDALTDKNWQEILT